MQVNEALFNKILLYVMESKGPNWVSYNKNFWNNIQSLFLYSK